MDARPANRHDVVLVVEDEPFTRWMAADVLSSVGFVVLEAGSAGEALAILEAHEDVRVVFTDVEMPGPVDGLELARRIGERWPSIRVVITSGRPSYKEKIPETDTFLAKPYTGPALVRQIEDITQETAEAGLIQRSFLLPHRTGHKNYNLASARTMVSIGAGPVSPKCAR